MFSASTSRSTVRRFSCSPTVTPWSPRSSISRSSRSDNRSDRRVPCRAVRRYHVTTFGCQMNAHDSERIKGMLESLGLGEAVAPEEADVVVFNTCTIREKPDTRLAAYLGNAAARKRRAARPRDRGRRLLRRGPARADLRAVPVRRRRVRPGLDPAPRRLDRRGRARGPAGTLRHRTSTSRPTCPRTASVASRPGCRCRWAATRSAPTASFRRCEGASRAADRARSSPRSRALARDGVREITLLGQNVNSWGRDLAPGLRTEFGELLRACDAIDGIERIRFTSPHPKDFREPVIAAMAECGSVCEHVHLPLQIGLVAPPEAHAPDVRPRALPPARRSPARGDPGPRARHRLHRRVSRRDGGGLRRRRSRSSRRSATTARSRSSSRRGPAPRRPACRTRCPTTSSTSASSGSSSVVQRIAAERNAERVGRVEEVLVEGPSRTSRLLRGRTRRNTTVNFAGRRGRSLVTSSSSSTSTTLGPRVALVAA